MDIDSEMDAGLRRRIDNENVSRRRINAVDLDKEIDSELDREIIDPFDSENEGEFDEEEEGGFEDE